MIVSISVNYLHNLGVQITNLKFLHLLQTPSARSKSHRDLILRQVSQASTLRRFLDLKASFGPAPFPSISGGSSSGVCGIMMLRLGKDKLAGLEIDAVV
jgi:hypothetical protein